MPLYHFTFTNGRHVITDLEGVDLANLAAAREHALSDARRLMDRHIACAIDQWRVDITNEDGQPMMTVPFFEVGWPN